ANCRHFKLILFSFLVKSSLQVSFIHLTSLKHAQPLHLTSSLNSKTTPQIIFTTSSSQTSLPNAARNLSSCQRTFSIFNCFLNLSNWSLFSFIATSFVEDSNSKIIQPSEPRSIFEGTIGTRLNAQRHNCLAFQVTFFLFGNKQFILHAPKPSPLA
ncbi:hypothetical protein B0J14DRAFT_102025, partial [Halenospora varia]